MRPILIVLVSWQDHFSDRVYLDSFVKLVITRKHKLIFWKLNIVIQSGVCNSNQYQIGIVIYICSQLIVIVTYNNNWLRSKHYKINDARLHGDIFWFLACDVKKTYKSFSLRF